jgi:arylsulfatase A-like enzyme
MLSGRPSSRQAAPNVLFIMTDAQRQDALSIYGNRILRTPNMDRVGAGGARFDQAFVTNSLCAPRAVRPSSPGCTRMRTA